MSEKTKPTEMKNSIGFGRPKQAAQEGKVSIGRGRAHLDEDLSKIDAASEKHGYDRSSSPATVKRKAERATEQFKVRVTPSMQEEIQEFKDSQVGLTNTKLFADLWNTYKEKNPKLFS
jgi:hypothetical protein